MKPVRNKDGSFSVDKGSIHVRIIPGQDRPPKPVMIEHDGDLYYCKKGLIETVKAFESAYSEEQVLEVLVNLV